VSEKVCEFCQSLFVTNRSDKKFCNYKCMRASCHLNQKIRRNEKKQLITTTCVFCQISFVTNRSTQKFCNRLCRGRNHEQKPERKNGSKRKHSQLKSKLKPFGFTVEDYESESWNQGHVCAICGQPETDTHTGTLRRLAVDHDHKTGCYRGLLCGKCNKGIGLFRDNVAILKQAIQYLEKVGSRNDNA
jgi:hypothetical protein